MSIKNINQNVTENYSKNFIVIFGDEPINHTLTGTYRIDEKTHNIIKLDTVTTKSVLKKIEPLMDDVRNMNPINIKKKED